MKPTEVIRSYLLPQDNTADADEDARLLHQQYDNMFKDIVTSEWCDSSDGNVESPQGYFTLTTIERNEVTDYLTNFATVSNLDARTQSYIHAWPGQLAGHYVTQEDSHGIIRVFAFDRYRDALDHYAKLEEGYGEWDDAAKADEHGFDGLEEPQ
jgi:hypothetical protein